MSNIFVGQTIAFDEDKDSPKGEMQNGTYTVTIIGYTAWGSRDAFATSLMPVGSNVGGIIGAALIANRKFRVRSFQWIGFGGLLTADSQGLNTYPLCKFTIQCNIPRGQLPDGSQPYTPPDPVPNLIHRWSSGGQYLTMPNRSLKWKSDGAAVSSDTRAGLFVPTIEHTITWPRLLQPPVAAIRACMGKISNADLQLATGLMKKGQGLFLGAESERENLSDGTLATTLSYKISERPIQLADGTWPDWNFAWRDDNTVVAGYDQLCMAADTSKFPLLSASFQTLFPPGIF